MMAYSNFSAAFGTALPTVAHPEADATPASSTSQPSNILKAGRTSSPGALFRHYTSKSRWSLTQSPSRRVTCTTSSKQDRPRTQIIRPLHVSRAIRTANDQDTTRWLHRSEVLCQTLSNKENASHCRWHGYSFADDQSYPTASCVARPPGLPWFHFSRDKFKLKGVRRSDGNKP